MERNGNGPNGAGTGAARAILVPQPRKKGLLRKWRAFLFGAGTRLRTTAGLCFSLAFSAFLSLAPLRPGSGNAMSATDALVMAIWRSGDLATGPAEFAAASLGPGQPVIVRLVSMEAGQTECCSRHRKSGAAERERRVY
jgi:hypothetical protein